MTDGVTRAARDEEGLGILLVLTAYCQTTLGRPVVLRRWPYLRAAYTPQVPAGSQEAVFQS